MKLFHLVAVLACVLCCCARPLHHAKRMFYRMDTVVEITIVTSKTDAAIIPAWTSIDSLLIFWEEHYSQTRPNSEIKAINNRTAGAVAINPSLGKMIRLALGYSDTTGGSYDITVGPLKELWGLGEVPGVQRVPPPDTLARTLAMVGSRHIRISDKDDSLYFDNPKTVIDAGGFAKGFALIATAQLIQKQGFSDFLISAGDVISKGHRYDGTPWRIGIQHPRNPALLLATVELDSGVVFTSGDYERFWMNGSTRVHHIFNPQTGFSCTGNQSVTIWSMDALQAKFLSTGLFCKPADSILAFAQNRNLECLVVDSAGTVRMSRGWKQKVKILEPAR